MKLLGKNMARCTLCQKGPTSGSAVSHSQIHTKRTFKPNLQKVNGLLLCSRCLKSIKKTKRAEDIATEERKAERLKAKEEAKLEKTEKKSESK